MANLYDKIKSEQGRGDPELTNFSVYDSEKVIDGCMVITFDGVPGFMWVGPDGVRRNAGMKWPTMHIINNATVHILYDDVTGEHSVGWVRGDE